MRLTYPFKRACSRYNFLACWPRFWRSAIATGRTAFRPALIASLLLAICTANPALAQTPNNDIEFLSGYYNVPYIIAVDDVYARGSQQPLGTVNDGFGVLRATIIPGLENLFVGRANRDTRVADLNNDGLPDIISNTYSCVDPVANPGDIARVYLNNGDGSFTEVVNPFRDSQGNPIELRGRGETIVVADFNNDGYLDAFLPFYTFARMAPPGCQNSQQSYLLMNDGTGHFTDIAVQAGVNVPNQYPSIEGAQALDFNGDGLIDLYGAGHLFINLGSNSNVDTGDPTVFPQQCNPLARLNANLNDAGTSTSEDFVGRFVRGPVAFVDVGPALGLPLDVAEEGAKFIDWNNDGTLGLIIHDSAGHDLGPVLYGFDGLRFTKIPNAFPTDGNSYTCTFGINAYDLNNDGRDDVIVREGAVVNGDGLCSAETIPSRLFVNQGVASPFRFQLSNIPFNPFVLGNGGCPGGASGFGDFNNDGRIDVVFCSLLGAVVATSNTNVHNADFVVEVLGPHGERNQQGRVVRVSPVSHPEVIYTRVVDSGSGYLSQNQYPLLIGSRYNETHTVNLSLPRRFGIGEPVPISFIIAPGERARVFAPSAVNPNGRVQIERMRPFTFSPTLFQTVMSNLD